MKKFLIRLFYFGCYLLCAGCVSYKNGAYDINDSHTQNKLGVKYLLGQGVVQDDTIARAWFEKAARQGNSYAENELGYLYAAGRGVVHNDVTALQWYQKAADHGLASAQYNAGLMYANGIGTPIDQAKAKQLFQMAVSQGFQPAHKALAQLDKAQ